MSKHSKVTHSVDSAVSSVAQTEASEIRKRAEDLAKELVGNVQFYETQERWGCFDIAKGWPEVIKAPHTKHGRLKRVLTASLVPKIEAALRLSEDAAQGSEARPGVGTAVESNTADEKVSAETGGEKAAECQHSYLVEVLKCAECKHVFRQQKLDVGWKLVPEKGGSREPEKLNNAQESLSQKDWDADVKSPLDVEPNPRICAECKKGFHPHHTRGWAGHKFVALAESSLSSPPPKEAK